MKKAVIPALLVIFAFGPCLQSSFEALEASQVVSVLGSQFFWHLWDDLLVRELTGSSNGAQVSEQSQWLHHSFGCVLFRLLVQRAFAGLILTDDATDGANRAVSEALSFGLRIEAAFRS